MKVLKQHSPFFVLFLRGFFFVRASAWCAPASKQTSVVQKSRDCWRGYFTRKWKNLRLNSSSSLWLTSFLHRWTVNSHCQASMQCLTWMRGATLRGTTMTNCAPRKNGCMVRHPFCSTTKRWRRRCRRCRGSRRRASLACPHACCATCIRDTRVWLRLFCLLRTWWWRAAFRRR